MGSLPGMELRLADPRADGAAVAAIYAPQVTEGFASFEASPPDPDEMCRRIATTLERLPWLVAAEAGETIAYAYASRHHERAGYRWDVDVSTYVRDDWHRRGVGSALLRALFALLVAQGYVNAYAGIAQPNHASVRLHRSLGMTAVGTYHGVGYKGGTWRDVTWLEVALQPRPAVPPEPIALPALLAGDEGEAILRAALGSVADALRRMT